MQSASLQANDTGNRRLHNLHQVLRDAGKNTAPPVIARANPRTYDSINAAFTSTGHPMVLMSSEAMAGVKRTSRAISHDAPHAVPAKKVKPLVQPPKNYRKLPAGLSFRVVCRKCGRKKSEHHSEGRKCLFGPACHWSTCGKCSGHVQNHMQHNVPMGFFCTLTAQQGARVSRSDQHHHRINNT